MARKLAPDEVTELDTHALTPADVPPELHQHSWREWLAQVNEHPTTDLERGAAYQNGDWQPNPFTPLDQLVNWKPEPITKDWREQVAHRLQGQAYKEWLAANVPGASSVVDSWGHWNLPAPPALSGGRHR